jgi:uncharacterized membrane protein (DUF2068 family)
MSDAPQKRDAGVRLITFYKLAKGILSLSGSAALAITILAGGAPYIASWAASLAHHLTRAWTLQLAHLLLGVARPDRLWLAAGALAVDGALTTVEGWALHHGKRWGEWLVVVATGSLLPFEVAAIVRGLHPWRIAAFVLNLAIVVYLARRAARHATTVSAAPPTPGPPGGRSAPSPPLEARPRR